MNPGARCGRVPQTGAAALFLAVLLATAAPGTARAASSEEPGEGSVRPTLKRVAIGQHKLRGSIVLSADRPLPPIRRLKRFPDGLRTEQRRLCVAADGKAIKRRLLCVGGAVEKGRVRVGVSRYKHGSTRKDHGFQARLKRISPTAIRLEFKLADAGFDSGRFRYRGLSTWRDAACAVEASSRRRHPQSAQPRPARPRALPVCHSRSPRIGTIKGRIFKVVRSGCTKGGPNVFRDGPRSSKRIALTFDDGPSPYTSRIMRSLDAAGAKGTFFQVGAQIGGYTDLMRKLVAHGHELANHSYAHEQYPSSASIAKTDRLIRSATGFEPCDFRPPYGAFNGGTVDAAKSNDLALALWDIDTSDYRRPGSGAIYSRAIQAGRGSIVLMHDGGGPRSQTADAVPRIIDKLQSRGYELVTVAELMGGRFKLREKR